MSASIMSYRRQRRNRDTPRTSSDIQRELDHHLEDRIAQQALYLQMRAEIEDNGFDEMKANSLEVLEVLIADSQVDLEYKSRLFRRFQGHPYAVTVPDGRSERYQKLLDTATDLRTLWPAEQFATDILGVQLERRGSRLVGLCPLHQESPPSFTVYPETDTFWCFGCFQSGDGIDIFALTGRWQNLGGFRHQVEWLATFSRGWFESEGA